MTIVLVTSLSRDLLCYLLSRFDACPSTHWKVGYSPKRKKQAVKMALVRDSAPVFSLDENDFNVRFLKEVDQSRDIPVKTSSRASTSTNSSSPNRSCGATSGSCRQCFFVSYWAAGGYIGRWGRGEKDCSC